MSWTRKTTTIRLSHAAAKKTHAASKQKHMSKLQLLMDRQKKKSIELRPEGHTRWVVNLSDKGAEVSGEGDEDLEG